MKKFSTLKLSALAAFVALGSSQTWAQTARISTLAFPVPGVVLVKERIGTAGNGSGTVGDSLAGMTFVPGNAPLTGDSAMNAGPALSPTSIALFTLTGRTISGPDQATDFRGYYTIGDPLTTGDTYSDIAHQLTLQAEIYSSGASSYSGLTWLP